MMNLKNHFTIRFETRTMMQNIFVLNFFLMSACSNLTPSPKISSNTLLKNETSALIHIAPEIPFIQDKAFFPIHPNGEGVYYSWRECAKRFVWCTKWEMKTIIFRFDNKEQMGWFINNDFGFKKRQNP